MKSGSSSSSTRTEEQYFPYDDETQPPRAIDGYPRSQWRTPIGPFVRRPVTFSERSGPTGLEKKLKLGPEDMSKPFGSAKPQALGQYIYLNGRVFDEDHEPVPGAMLELWQANASGKYIHEFDQNDAAIDPNFVGALRVVTDADGRFTFRTIQPGAYPVSHSTWEWRAPHIHISAFGRSWLTRLITQMFFPGQWINGQDLLLNAIPSVEARERLIARPVLPTVVKPSDNILGLEHHLVLRGRRGTPVVIDHDDAPPPSSRDAFASMTTGPFFPPQFLDPGVDDLAQYDGKRAGGQKILLVGRVLEQELRPTINTIVELWQPDANGIFRDPRDPRYAQLDPGFTGWGRTFTDKQAWYKLTTVLPGSYTGENGKPRVPHINVMLLASGILRPLLTTVFFGDPSASHDDPVLNCVTDPDKKRRLFAVRDPSLDANGAQAYRFDILLQGEKETPFFLD